MSSGSGADQMGPKIGPAITADIPASVAKLVELEERGLITRTQDTYDSRVRRLAVTKAGAALATKAVAVVEAADARYFAEVADLDELNVILHLERDDAGRRDQRGC